MHKTTLTTPDAHEVPRYFNPLAPALEADGVAVNYFERDPGESIGDCYHRHHEQEELFVVMAGTATFDTEEGDVTVETGEVVRFAPGEWQQGWNRGTERLSVLAIGAPQDAGPTDLMRECPECGERTPAVVEESETEVEFTCGDCGAVTGRYP